MRVKHGCGVSACTATRDVSRQRFAVAVLRSALEMNLPSDATGLVLALSGGADSACLAFAVSQLGVASVRGLPVRAVHVDHGLQPAAAAFRDACARLCGRLGLPLEILKVSVPAAGRSVEAAARDARYDALARSLTPGECVLTAHHALDQAETVLLQLLRGAGLKGLSAMPACRALGSGWHLRPLLDVSPRELREFAAAAGLEALVDPMNSDPRFDRAYLRTQLWPLIEARWPGAVTALTRTAHHVADAQALLDAAAAGAVQALRDGHALSIAGLRLLPEAQQRNALRHWIGTEISGHGTVLPSTARLSEALRQCLAAQDDRLPAVVWGEHALRRYRDRLFVTAAQPPRLHDRYEWSVHPAARLDLGPSLGILSWTAQIGGLDPARLPPTVQVRPRSGGETLKPHLRARTQSVQHLLQSLGVLPWMRDAVPLLYVGEQLIAVGDWWLDAGWCVARPATGVSPEWQDAPHRM